MPPAECLLASHSLSVLTGQVRQVHLCESILVTHNLQRPLAPKKNSVLSQRVKFCWFLLANFVDSVIQDWRKIYILSSHNCFELYLRQQ